MTTRPRLRLGRTLIPGVLAIALFGLMALIVLNTSFGDGQGFPDGIAITSELGYAMFDLDPLQSEAGSIPNTEAFLAAFLLIALALDAALDGAIVLAKREENGEPIVALPQDGGSVSGPAQDEQTAATDGGVSDTGAETSAASTDDTDTESETETGGDDR
ncbi:hypothetical protein C483_17508 [Natrialba hulunbeirensis JCM 10989]|uniref:NADH dehydrogenase-like complex subunit J2 n=1 Tax=Natrialba hulunbeirensis JCM 10989 TaxID=1227493 RepID=L9ZMX6_9EURY|nr:hypothetical protein [Natrialba hulunbeirensis]ELY87719.1 hypothetical protein C483_17508 [Natrialba hulunbeirensis JCM 10989]